MQERPANRKTDDPLAEARALIEGGTVSCVIIQDNAIAHTAGGRGIAPLLEVYTNHPDMLKGALVVDKIIGKAAAMILALGGAARAYGLIMSMAGRAYLARRGIAAGCGRCVGALSGRNGKGICPIEQSVMEMDDPREGLAAVRAVLTDLISAAANR